MKTPASFGRITPFILIVSVHPAALDAWMARQRLSAHSDCGNERHASTDRPVPCATIVGWE
jgi:hypothetical protein